jgi:hypothetical protein
VVPLAASPPVSSNRRRQSWGKRCSQRWLVSDTLQLNCRCSPPIPQWAVVCLSKVALHRLHGWVMPCWVAWSTSVNTTYYTPTGCWSSHGAQQWQGVQLADTRVRVGVSITERCAEHHPSAYEILRVKVFHGTCCCMLSTGTVFTSRQHSQQHFAYVERLPWALAVLVALVGLLALKLCSIALGQTLGI